MLGGIEADRASRRPVAGVKALPDVKLVMYFNLRWVTSDGTVQNYLVDSTPAAKSAWIETVANPALRPPLP